MEKKNDEQGERRVELNADLQGVAKVAFTTDL